MSFWIRSDATIYTLTDPRDGLVRYVGCAGDIQERYEQHLYRPGTNEGKRMWIEGLMQEGMAPRMDTIETVQASIVGERERYWIAHFLLVLDMPLLNRTKVSRKTLRNMGLAA